MAQMPQSQVIQFWAKCPFCPPNAHGAVFPVSVLVTFEVDWGPARVNCSGTLTTDPVTAHMQTRHPNLIETQQIDMAAELVR